MYQNKRDLLICGIDSDEAALELKRRFADKFPQITIHTVCGIIEPLFSILENRFSVVVVIDKARTANGAMCLINIFCDHDYSPDDVFLYHLEADDGARGPAVAGEFSKGDEEGLLAAAEKAASLKFECRWQTPQQIEEARIQSAKRREAYEKLRAERAPPRKSRISRFANFFRWR